MKLAGANANPQVRGVDELPGKSNYFIGNDSRKWRTNVPNYAKVKYTDVYPDIDLIYYGDQRQLEFDFVVAPGADPQVIRLAFEVGDSQLENRNSKSENRQSPSPKPQLVNPELRTPNAGSVHVNANGDLVIPIDGGEVRFRKPLVYQEKPSSVRGQSSAAKDQGQRINNHRQFVDGRYVLRAAKAKSKIENPKYEVSFEIASYDPRKPLVIDPVLSYSTFLGGSGFDSGNDIAIDGMGNAHLTGLTLSPDFPLANAFDNDFGGEITSVGDAFVTKLNPGGTALVYSTYLGGTQTSPPDAATGDDEGRGIAVDANGNVFVAGVTHSTNFPTTSGAFREALQARKMDDTGTTYSQDAFVVKLNSTGSTLLYSTYLGGSGEDFGDDIAIDSTGNAYVTGIAGEPPFDCTPLPCTVFVTAFPTAAGAFDVSANGGDDAFLTKLNANGSGLVYSTFLGGTGDDVGDSVAVDIAEIAYVTGTTAGGGFPTTPGALDETHNGGQDAFVSAFGAAGASLVYSTFLGSNQNDVSEGIAVDNSGNAFVTGYTFSETFPVTTGAADTTCGTDGACNFDGASLFADSFVAKLDPIGASLVYSTFLGGSHGDLSEILAVDGSGNAYVTGLTASSDFPTVNPTQPAFGGGICGVDPGTYPCPDVFVSKLNPDGSAFTFSTYLGGTNFDNGNGIVVDSAGNAYVTGAAASTTFPTTSGALQRVHAGQTDGFVSKIATTLTVAPSSLSFGNHAVGTTSTPLTVTLTNVSGATVTINSVAISAEFGATNHCGATLAAGANCTIDVTFTPLSTGAKAGELAIDTDATAAPLVVSLSGNGGDFSLEASSGSSTSATVTAGQTATYNLRVQPTGFTGDVSLTCAESITAATCAVSPTLVTLDGATARDVTVSVSTTRRSVAPPGPLGVPPALDWLRSLRWQIWLLLVLAALTMTAARSRKPGGLRFNPAPRRAAWGLATAVLVAALLTAACGGGGGSAPPPQTGTPAGNYTLTVTGNSGNLSHSITLSLRVN